MYWWSIEKLAYNLKQNNYVRSDSILFWLLNIILTICQFIVYTSLLFSFLLIEYHFKDWLTTQHPNIMLCQQAAYILSFVNTGLMVVGIVWCYYQHKKYKGINFWQRFSALNSSIGFHVLLYATAVLFIAVSVLYVLIHIRIETFKGTIIPIESTADFFNRLFTSPFGIKSITAPQQSRGFFASLASLPGTIASLPFIPGRIAAFLQELRVYIMQFYPVLAATPTLLLIIQYYLVQRWFVILGSKQNLPAVRSAPQRAPRKTAAPKKAASSKKSPTTKKATPLKK